MQKACSPRRGWLLVMNRSLLSAERKLTWRSRVVTGCNIVSRHYYSGESVMSWANSYRLYAEFYGRLAAPLPLPAVTFHILHRCQIILLGDRGTMMFITQCIGSRPRELNTAMLCSCSTIPSIHLQIYSYKVLNNILWSTNVIRMGTGRVFKPLHQLSVNGSGWHNHVQHFA